MRELIAVNGLSPPYALRSGQTLRLPTGGEHTVRGGETLYEISRRYGVDMHTLAHLNGLRAPYTLSHGQRLRLPGEERGAVVASAAPAGRPGGDVPAPTASDRGSGRVSVEPIGAPPAASQVSTPPPSGAASTSAAASAGGPRDDLAGRANPVGRPEVPISPDAASRPGREPPAASPAAAEARTVHAPPAVGPPPRAAGRFLWPVRGRVISEFGPKAGGLHNDGINIAVPRGEPVRAAENGVVAYAGNELKGFGNLLLLRHAEGWISAYAHNDVLLVKRGDAVRRGQTIARAGATGNVASPQVHFELRQGTRAVDPRAYLTTQTAGN
jgi:murein DD-endopeptidase MepM/ murein hydrolase activator NlpD